MRLLCLSHPLLILSLHLLVPSTASLMADPALSQALSAALGTKVFLPGTSGYNESTTSYYSAFEHELKPGLVVKPTSREDVATIIRLTKPLVDSGKVQLAIRGGGATPVAGVANINRGITIDMRSVTGITLIPENSIVSIGAGESWGDVYGKLESQGLAVAGGRTSRSGVGGHLTNGIFDHRYAIQTCRTNRIQAAFLSSRRGKDFRVITSLTSKWFFPAAGL